MDRRMKFGTFPRTLVLLLTLVWAGCGTDHGPANPSGGAQDSTTVILSKYYSSRNYRNWLGRLSEGADLPPLRFVQAYGLKDSLLLEEWGRASAVVLTGGEDIHPARYGQAADTVRCGTIDEERDRVEHLLLDWVIEGGMPCLGVCRGLQVMNVHGGGSMHPHLPDVGHQGHWGGRPGDTRDTLHPVVVVAPWTFGEEVFRPGDGQGFVSHHHQGIDRLAGDYFVWARSEGGLAEGIRYADTLKMPFLVGVQWHPERSEPGHALSDGLGRALLTAATGH